MDLTHYEGLELEDRAVAVVGLGIEGVDLARFLCNRDAEVTISDSKTREQLADRLTEVGDLPVKLSLGSDQTRDLEKAELVFVSQGVPLDLPGLKAARERGVPLLVDDGAVPGDLPWSDRRHHRLERKDDDHGARRPRCSRRMNGPSSSEGTSELGCWTTWQTYGRTRGRC